MVQSKRPFLTIPSASSEAEAERKPRKILERPNKMRSDDPSIDQVEPDNF